MKIECTQEKFREVVNQAERIAGRHTSLPVLSCIILDASAENSISIKSTNLDMALEVTIPSKTHEKGIVAIPAATLNSFVNNIVSEKGIILETSENNLKITTSHSSGVLKTQPHDDFPSIPKITDGVSFTLHTNDFVNGLRSVWYSSSVSNIKPELSSVYIYCDEEFVVFVATDSFRLAEKRIKVKKSKDFGQILIPFKNIPDIIKILESIHDEVEVRLNKNQISFSYKGLYFTSRVVDGVFPDYKQIIPKNSSTEVVVLKQDLIQALKISNIFSDKFNQINIKVDQTKKRCEIRTKNNDIGENTTILDSAITGEPIDMNFNYKYIIDCFQSVDSDSVNLIFSGSNKPMIIKPISHNSFRYLVMPMNK